MQQRCARWLLHTEDRVGLNTFPLTHQFLSQMLGVRRATVTEAMGGLQELQAVTYVMGTVTLLDRERLEAAACSCYAIVQAEFDRLLGGPDAEGRKIADPLASMRTSSGGKSTLGDAVSREGEPETRSEET
jgi:hypothetical protein